ncbi:MAG: hypothetical protein GVY06_07970 [Alphaproteobacteria bacterium]|jgi:hypothetical protein|nr:hypothetical protein [Alphaproteobacteria bacterium]
MTDQPLRTGALALVSLPLLAGCVVTAPAGMAYDGAKLAGKTMYASGKGVYQTGRLGVRVADGVLDGSERMLRLTILAADATGAVVRTSRLVSSTALEAELSALERAGGVVNVVIEPAEPGRGVSSFPDT